MEAFTLADVEEAAQILKPVLQPAPLLRLGQLFGDEPEREILLKVDIFQAIGSFKIRGVFHAVSRLDDAERQAGLSTVSAGNTAQALAWCGRHFGVSARSRMPEGAPQIKLDAVRRWGGEPIVVSREELFRFMQREEWHDEPYAFIHPWTNRDVMIGHGTMALEIAEALPEVAAVYIPVGGGGLLGGVARTLKLLRPNVRVVAVEPAGCAAFHHSMQAGHPVDTECQTICDGVAVPYFTKEVFEQVRDVVDETITVSDAAVLEMLGELALRNKLVVEPSGALAVVAARQHHAVGAGAAVALVCGGAVAPALLARQLSQ